MNAHLQRALMLLEQSREELAQDELRQVLGEDPNNAMAHAVLAICLSRQEKYQDAAKEAETAIHLAPDQPFVFYAQSIVHNGRNDLKAAKIAVQTAIGMDPYEANYFAQLGSLEFQQHQWQAALDAAEQGLNLDPEDVQCNNLRAMALVKLGKTIEADESLGMALGRDPEDAVSHANLGWSLLEQGKPEKAMEHFREALRLEPEMEWARAGIVEAMKARYFLYRIILNWFLWMVKLQKQAQWGVIIGAYIGYRILASVANNNPDLAPWLQPILIAYVAFAVMTWTASPLFNLALLTSKFGRLALSNEEIRTSTWVGLCVGGAILAIGAYFYSSSPEFLGCALAFGLMIPPLAKIYDCDQGWPRAVIVLITLALGGLGVVITTTLLAGHFLGGRLGQVLIGAGLIFFLPFVYGSIAAQFATIYLVMAQPLRGTDSGKKILWIGGSLLAMAAVLIVGFVGLVVVGSLDPG